MVQKQSHDELDDIQQMIHNLRLEEPIFTQQLDQLIEKMDAPKEFYPPTPSSPWIDRLAEWLVQPTYWLPQLIANLQPVSIILIPALIGLLLPLSIFFL
jgi:hypothetical protein